MSFMRMEGSTLNCYAYDSLDSTNEEAKRLAEQGAPHGAVVTADMQTAGKGRRGRSWVSPPGTNIYFTLIVRPEFAPEKASMLTLIAAHALARGIARETGVVPGIKWPNDIVIDGRKVCGILTEMSVEQNSIRHVVIGAGINVREQSFPPELAEKAIALDTACGRSVDRARLLKAVLEAFREDYEDFCKTESLTGIRDSYNRLLVNRDREVCVLEPGGEYRGISRGITDTGELIVERQDGSLCKVFAGEVSVRGIYGYV